MYYCKTSVNLHNFYWNTIDVNGDSIEPKKLLDILYIYGPCCMEICRLAYRNMTSEGKQIFIYPYNKGHKLFIISKLHTQQNIF
jgi:hypothetical protein